MRDEAKKSTGSWWQTVPGILTAAGTVIAAVAALVVALHQAGIIGCDCTEDSRSPFVGGLEAFVGNYHYLSTPDDVDFPLIDEQGNSCYQFIGDLSIQKFQQGYSVNATRYYCVTIENGKGVLKRISSVEWGAKSDDVFIPQVGQEIIFLLTTNKELPNRGLVKASITERTKEGNARIISGTMLYLIPRNFEKKRTSPHWLRAKVEFRRNDKINDPNYFTNESVYNVWLSSKNLIR